MANEKKKLLSFDADLALTGNLTVKGTTISENVSDLLVKDALIVANADGTDVATTLVGTVYRISETEAYAIAYDITSDAVHLGKGSYAEETKTFTFAEGEGRPVAVRADSADIQDGHVLAWDAETFSLVSAGRSLTDIDDKIDQAVETIEGEIADLQEAIDGIDVEVTSEKVVMSKDLVFTAPVGTVTQTMINDGNGSYTLAAKDKSLQQVLDGLFATENTTFNPTKPTVTITANSNNGNKAYEVGTTASVSYSMSFSKGSYPYGPADTGVTLTSYNVSFNGETKNTQTGTFEVLITDGFKKAISATASYSDGVVPNSNLGNPVPGKKITAGNTAAVTGSEVSGYRNYFYGATTKDVEQLTSDDIRAMNKGGNYNAAKNFEIKASDVTGAKYFIVAIPKDSSRGGVSKVESTAGMTVDVTAQWTKNSSGRTLGVADARGGTNGLKDYYISYWTAASVDSATVHKVYLA